MGGVNLLICSGSGVDVDVDVALSGEISFYLLLSLLKCWTENGTV